MCRDTECKLTDRGREQAKELGTFLRSKGLTSSSYCAVYSSPATRAYDTGRIVCAELGISEAEIITDDALLEISQGDWELGTRCCEAPDNRVKGTWDDFLS